MMRLRPVAFVLPFALAGALGGCVVEPDPYVGAVPSSAYATPAPYGYAPPPGPAYVTPSPVWQDPRPAYVTPSPSYLGPNPYPVPYAAQRPDRTGYCAEALGNAADASNRAAFTGDALDAARAQRTAEFYRRDC